MKAWPEESIAFARPGGQARRHSRARPLDLAHLSRQTFGDRELELEVLGLFLQQAITVRDSLAKAMPAERARLAHALRGAAAGIGAARVAEYSRAVEHEPADPLLVRRLGRAIEEARDFIVAISR